MSENFNEMVWVNIQIPRPIKERAETLAARRGNGMSSYVRQLLYNDIQCTDLCFPHTNKSETEKKHEQL